jgi:predicted RNase H-like HicB family nuclease
MQYPIIVRELDANGYVAQPIGLPELQVQAASEAEAIAQVKQALEQWLATVKVVQVSIPGAGTGNPWIDSAGRSADDPTWEMYQEELRKARLSDVAP